MIIERYRVENITLKDRKTGKVHQFNNLDYISYNKERFAEIDSVKQRPFLSSFPMLTEDI